MSLHVGLLVYDTLDQPSGGYRYDRKLVEYLRAYGDTVDIITVPRRSYARNLLNGASRSLRRRLDRPFDVLLQDHLCHPSVWYLNRFLDRPTSLVTLVHMVWSSHSRTRFDPVYRTIERSHIKSVDAAICTSQDTQRRLEQLASIESLVAYPGGRSGGRALSPARVERRACRDPLRILFLGSLLPRKDPETVIAALASLDGTWEATFVGPLDADPAFSEQVRQLIATHDLTDRVRIRGPVADDELKRILETVHVLAVPSRYEPFGMAYLEAMEYGVVPIASSSGGATELVEDGRTGYVVEPGGADRLRERLATLRDDRNLLARLGKDALSAAEAHPEWPESLGQIRAWLLSIVEKHSARADRSNRTAAATNTEQSSEECDDSDQCDEMGEILPLCRRLSTSRHYELNSQMTETAYLTAKRTIDDRSLNRHVLESFTRALEDRDDGEVGIIEVGAGTGTMPVRLARWDALPDSVDYRVVDRNPKSIAQARERVPNQFASMGYTVERGECGTESEFVLTRGEQQLRLRFETADAFDISGNADAVIACAFLDLVPLPDALQELRRLLEADGLLYAPITFDGLTEFRPSHPHDDQITNCYHQHMASQRPGGPDAGRTLLESIPTSGGEILAAGGSDWIIRPVGGTYPDDEQLVLEVLLSTIRNAVSELDHGLAQTTIDAWVDDRLTQIETGSLCFLAHNLDILCQFQ